MAYEKQFWENEHSADDEREDKQDRIIKLLKKENERLRSDLLADQVAFEALHELHPELGLNERAKYINTTLKL